MKVDICRRCHRLNTEQPRTNRCPNGRLSHLWVSVSSAIGMRLANKLRAARSKEQADRQSKLEEEAP